MTITAVIHDCSEEGETGFSARCAEFPEANGQGHNIQEALEDLKGAIADILDYRRSEAEAALKSSEKLLESAF